MHYEDNMEDYLYEKNRDDEAELKEASKLQIIMKEKNQGMSEKYATGKAYIWDETKQTVEADGEMRGGMFYVREREKANHGLLYWKFNLRITGVNTKNTPLLLSE